MQQRTPELIETMSNLVAQQPFFAVYLYNNMEVVEDPSVKTAQTNGFRITVNPNWFNKKPIGERVFVMCHEILHGLLEHMSRSKGYAERGFGPDLKIFNHKIANDAQDYIINDTLKKSGIGSMPPSGLWSPDITCDDLMDSVYVTLNGKAPDPDSPDQDENATGGADQPSDKPDQRGTDEPGEGFDEHIMPEKGEVMSPEDTKTAVAQAQQAAEAQGNMPAALKRVIGALLDPKVSWEDQFRNTITARQGMDTTTWRRANRRRLAIAPNIYMPGRTGHQIGGIVLGIDVSGSVNEPMLTSFFSEAIGLLSEVKAEWIRVFLWNTHNMCPEVGGYEINEPEEILDIPVKGSGGTRLEDMAKHLDDNDIFPEQIVWFTDGITSYSEVNPFSCDVVWCLTTSRRTPKYGAIIQMNE